MDNIVFKIKSGYVVRDIAGEYLAVPVNCEEGAPEQIVILNVVSKFLWEQMETGKSFQELLDGVMSNFEDVDPVEAKQDIAEFLAQLKNLNLLK